MNQTLIDNLRYVLQNMRLQKGEIAKVQADIVAQAMVELGAMGRKIADLERTVSKYRNGKVDSE